MYRQLHNEAVLLLQQAAAAVPLGLVEGRAGGQEIGLIWYVLLLLLLLLLLMLLLLLLLLMLLLLLLLQRLLLRCYVCAVKGSLRRDCGTASWSAICFRRISLSAAAALQQQQQQQQQEQFVLVSVRLTTWFDCLSLCLPLCLSL